MSRIGKAPITVPPGVTVKIEDNHVTVSGPRGELRRQCHRDMIIKLEDGILSVQRPTEGYVHRSLHGLTRSLLANMVTGVTSGFQRNLDIVGVGYRAEKAGEKLILRVGYSHSVEVTPMEGITLDTEGVNQIKVMGIDKQVVGEMASKIRAIRPPDAYKGKGIRYAREVVHLKPGKAGKVVGRK